MNKNVSTAKKMDEDHESRIGLCQTEGNLGVDNVTELTIKTQSSTILLEHNILPQRYHLQTHWTETIQ